ncbi:hypothetical protein Tco_0810102 [Tanacetum coccineum]
MRRLNSLWKEMRTLIQMSLWMKFFNSQEDLDTRIESGSHKKCPDVKKSANVLIIHDDEGEELVRDALIHRKREKGKMNRRYGYMFRHLQKSFMPSKDFKEMEKAFKSTLKKVIDDIK